MTTAMKTENWNGHEIRFVEVNGEWWAVLKDIADALGLNAKFIKQRLGDEVVSNNPIPDTMGRMHDMLIVNEFGIYDAIFSSKKKEAKEFKHWVYEALKKLRESSGLAGFQIFRMLDKEHQKEMMRNLSNGLEKPVRVDFIKANTIANKAVSNKHGLPKMIKKGDMTPQMLAEREPILEDTVELMKAKERFSLNVSISDQIYKMHS